MAVEVKTKTYGRVEGHRFLPQDLIANFAAYTGRRERTEEQIENMVQSLLANGQEMAIVFRKDQYTGAAVPMSGHTRILAADRINQKRLTGYRLNEKGERIKVKYGPDNPFLIYGLYKRVNEVEALFHTFIENDPETRTALSDLDAAYFIQIVSTTTSLTDKEIAEKLGKNEVWVSKHRKLLDLDQNTIKEVAQGDVAFNTAVDVVANIEPKSRKAVIERAKKNNGGRATAAAITAAAVEMGANTSKPLKPSEADFRVWLKEMAEDTAVGPLQALFFAMLDYRKGTITRDELTAKKVVLEEALAGEEANAAA